VLICDVGPRDGLQNEAAILEPAVRAELCRRLAGCGLRRVEAASFVNPKLVPQMAGADDVFAALPAPSATVFTALALNERGYERAVAAGARHVNYSFAVTDEFCRRNQNSTVADCLSAGHAVARRARADGIRLTVTLSVSFGCPFEGPVPPEKVERVVEQVLREAPEEIVLADTIGVGVPAQVARLVPFVVASGAVAGCHFHNTRNTGYANALAALEAGASLLDASAGGAGGCPFAPRATGNIATEDLVYLLRGMGVDTGIDLEGLLEVSRWLGSQLGKELPGMLARAGDFPVTQPPASAPR
jgi:isopropylmalate/homocitrate/citramalate synthase